MYGITVTKDDFNPKAKNPRFIAFLKAQQLNPGDKWKTYEFMRWCTSITDDYRKEKGLVDGERHNHNELTEWIKSKEEKGAQHTQLSLF